MKELAQVYSDAYDAQAGGKTWDGKDIPSWEGKGERVRTNHRVAVCALLGALGLDPDETAERYRAGEFVKAKVLPGQEPLPFDAGYGCARKGCTNRRRGVGFAHCAEHDQIKAFADPRRCDCRRGERCEVCESRGIKKRPAFEPLGIIPGPGPNADAPNPQDDPWPENMCGTCDGAGCPVCNP